MLRRLAPAAFMTIAFLAGCVPADEPQQSPTAPETVTTQTPSADETSAPAAETTEPTPETNGPSPSGEATRESTDEEDGDASPDLVDGVRTNDFGAMPTEIDGLTQRSIDTNPQNHFAQMEYFSQDEQTRLLFAAFIPELQGGERKPVSSADDQGYTEALELGRKAVEEVGTPEERTLDAGGLTWNCFEGHGNDQGTDAVLCLSHRYGRVLEMQRISAPEADIDAWRSEVEAALTEIGEAVDALSE